MRRYDEPIDVRRGLVSGQEAPEQFIWRDRLWVVRTIVAHWIETGSWWEQAGVAALLGVGASGSAGGSSRGTDLVGEREVWRVEAARGRRPPTEWGHGVFDLGFDWGGGQWQLICSID